jgi:hypothetical protein
MPNRYQRPASSQPLSHFNARSPAKKAQIVPRMLGIIAEARLVIPLIRFARTRRMVSRITTGGVSTTANAKLKSSASDLATPASSAVEMVVPDRENPRNGRQSPCTTPIHPCLLYVQVTCVRWGFQLFEEKCVGLNSCNTRAAEYPGSHWGNGPVEAHNGRSKM